MSLVMLTSHLFWVVAELPKPGWRNNSLACGAVRVGPVLEGGGG